MKNKQLTYLGKDHTTNNPQTNIYFKPTGPLVEHENKAKFQKTMALIIKQVNKTCSNNCEKTIWHRKYPLGHYDVVYFKDAKQGAAVYILGTQHNETILKFIETQVGDIKERVPTVNITVKDGS